MVSSRSPSPGRRRVGREAMRMEGLQITLDLQGRRQGRREGTERMNFNSAFKFKILTLCPANSSSAPPLGDWPQYSRNHHRREISSNVETRLNGYILQDVEETPP